jgi:diguanylate cyclase (GGDEF)-like protein
LDKFNIVVKLILPLIIGLFLIASISIYSNYFFIKQHIESDSKISFENVSSTIEHITDKEATFMEDLIDQLKKDPKTIEMYKNDQKEWLFMYLHQTYMKLHKNYGLTHFYIHKANRTNYLRVHNKSKSSDFINRETLRAAKDSYDTIRGVEFGISHNLTLRVVSPWIVDGVLIGYIELGKEIDLITKEYSDFTDKDIIFTINKELISEDNFNTWKNKNFRNRYYYDMDNFYVIDSTIDEIGTELQKALNEKRILVNKFVQDNNEKYFLNSKYYFDVNGKNVGKIFVLNNVTRQFEDLYMIIFKVTVVVSILLSVMIWYYFKYIKRTEEKLKDAYEEIRELSIHDGLTKLYNKLYYMDSVPQMIKEYSRIDGIYISFILIDVDNFKKYNDNYGHINGDNVLKEVSAFMLENFKRESDKCYRVGGEEFLIVTVSQDENNGYDMAQKLCKGIEELGIKHEYNSNFGVVTASIGVVSEKLSKKIDISNLYDSADKALYTSKDEGRNRVTKL